MSVVFVTHDLAVVAQTCQRLAVMYAGQVVETGHASTRCSVSPRHPYTLGLLRSVPDFDDVRDSLRSIPGSAARPRAAAAGLPLRIRAARSPRRTASSGRVPAAAARRPARGDGLHPLRGLRRGRRTREPVVADA